MNEIKTTIKIQIPKGRDALDNLESIEFSLCCCLVRGESYKVTKIDKDEFQIKISVFDDRTVNVLCAIDDDTWVKEFEINGKRYAYGTDGYDEFLDKFYRKYPVFEDDDKEDGL